MTPSTPDPFRAPFRDPARGPDRGLSRRGAVSLAVAGPLAALLSACSGSEVRDRLDSATRPLQAPRRTPPAPANPDQPVVDAAVRAIADLRGTLLPHRSADALVADLVQLHAHHLATLGAPAAAGTVTPLPAGRLLTEVVAREQALGALLSAKAAVAHDGSLARLLASMSAAVAQRIAPHASGGTT